MSTDPLDEVTLRMALAALDAAEAQVPDMDPLIRTSHVIVAFVRALGVLTGDAAGNIASAELAWAMVTDENHRFLFVEAYKRAAAAREIGPS